MSWLEEEEHTIQHLSFVVSVVGSATVNLVDWTFVVWIGYQSMQVAVVLYVIWTKNVAKIVIQNLTVM